MQRRFWTDAESRELAALWGTVQIGKLARKLGRSEVSVYQRARKMGLGSWHEGRYRLEEVSRITGFHGKAILIVIRAKEPTMLKYSNTKAARRRRYAFTDNDLSKIIRYMKECAPAGRVNVHHNPAWGACGKPPACVICGRSDVPHWVRGACKRSWCRVRLLRIENPDGCRKCGKVRSGKRLLCDACAAKQNNWLKRARRDPSRCSRCVAMLPEGWTLRRCERCRKPSRPC